MNLNVTGIQLTESQKELWKYANDNHNKYIIANWSRQSGKSTIVSLLCIKWLAMKEQEIIYITPTYSLAKKIYSNIVKLLPEEIILKSNSSDLVIESVLKSRLVFFSAESGQAIRRKYSNQINH